MECPRCGEELYRISGLCTDRDGIREDAYCTECHIRYGVRSHGLTVLDKKLVSNECTHKLRCCFYETETEV